LLVGDWELLRILLIGAGLLLLEYAVQIQLIRDGELLQILLFAVQIQLILLTGVGIQLLKPKVLIL
jgi:hypothetical protein